MLSRLYAACAVFSILSLVDQTRDANSLESKRKALLVHRLVKHDLRCRIVRVSCQIARES